MRRLKWVVAGLVVVAVLAVVAAGVRVWMRGPQPVGRPTSAPEGPGWIDLLDVAHAANWRNATDNKDIFEIRDGTLHIYGRTVYPLRYVGYMSERFADFDLHLEFKTARGANSGLFLRAQPNDPVYRGFEIQILDDYGRNPSKHGTGAVYDVVTPMFNVTMPHGQWNSFDISVRGKTLVVFVNGWKVIDTDFGYLKEPVGKFKVPFADLPLDGYVMLQDHGGEVWFRNIRVRAAGGAGA
ncbi:MAG: DUF1080 domain-containing protein [Candidatus Hydrogenedentes bacterium]|nr:DUF1080 domain-containing protein [Candidatus Hydrogenedentota bacterium]